MSSYKVDPKTGLPILYLLDQKQTLWERFSETYPNGMKRTAFMGHLENGPYRYREDLGGLCFICVEYGYNVFDDLIKIISFYVEDHKYQVYFFLYFVV